VWGATLTAKISPRPDVGILFVEDPLLAVAGWRAFDGGSLPPPLVATAFTGRRARPRPARRSRRDEVATARR
jgi:hypothetical protein